MENIWSRSKLKCSFYEKNSKTKFSTIKSEQINHIKSEKKIWEESLISFSRLEEKMAKIRGHLDRNTKIGALECQNSYQNIVQ